MKFTARVKAFSCEGIGNYEISVDTDGTVRVWDDVANAFTVCHSLSERTQAKLRKITAQKKNEE